MNMNIDGMSKLAIIVFLIGASFVAWGIAAGYMKDVAIKEFNLIRQ